MKSRKVCAKKAKREGVKNCKAKQAFAEKDAEFAILKVAYLLTAVDGEVAESERAAFASLAERCKEIDSNEAESVIRSATAAVEDLIKAYAKASRRTASVGDRVPVTSKRLLAGESSGLSEEAAMEIFMKEVDKVCDWAAFVKDSRRVRRAFVMWMVIVLADGEFAGPEKHAIESLRRMVNSYQLIGDEFVSSVKTELGHLRRFNDELVDSPDLETDRRLHERIEDAENRIAAMIQG